LRWQSVQILQIMHVVWPPFLGFFLYGRFRAVAEMYVDNVPVMIETSD